MESRSRWLVGSSSSSTSGWATRACARATRFLLPPDRVLHNGLGVQVQALQGFIHPLFPVPAVQGFDLTLHGIQIAMAQAVFLDQRRSRAASPARTAIENGGVGVQLRLLRHIGNAGAALHLQGAVIGLFHARPKF